MESEDWKKGMEEIKMERYGRQKRERETEKRWLVCLKVFAACIKINVFHLSGAGEGG